MRINFLKWLNRENILNETVKMHDCMDFLILVSLEKSESRAVVIALMNLGNDILCITTSVLSFLKNGGYKTVFTLQ